MCVFRRATPHPSAAAVPYVSSSTGALYDAIRSPEPVNLPEQPELSLQLRDLLARMLDKDPTSRICLEEVGVCVCVCPCLCLCFCVSSAWILLLDKGGSLSVHILQLSGG